MIEEFKWMFKWYIIDTEYGTQLIYEPEVFAKAFADNSYQHGIRELIESKKYDVFVDVGSAWGHFAMIASKLCKRVIAFEPHPLRYGILLFNCRHLFNVDCRYEFVTCKEDVPRMGKLQEMCEARHQKPYNVKTITLDDLKFEPNEKVLVKLDVEGSELKVLEGCPNLIANPNVDWIIDIHEVCGIFDNMIFPYFKHKYIKDHQNDHVTSVKEFYGNK